jgi:hypothetical protein
MSVFSLVVAGDRRLGVAHYRFLGSRLDVLLRNRLPNVRVLSGGGQWLDVLIERWAEEHGLAVDRFPPRRDYRNEGEYLEWVLAQKPSAVVVFDGSRPDPAAAELLRRARIGSVPLRIVNLTMFVQ